MKTPPLEHWYAMQRERDKNSTESALRLSRARLALKRTLDKIEHDDTEEV